MKGKTLAKPPLLEAIFEIKWKLEEQTPGFKQDPHYDLLIGRMYDRLNERYPFHQPLASASVPSEMIAGVVQHRFRTAKGQWPVVQIGPGVLTINDTQKYTWDSFEQRIIEAVKAFCGIYPNTQDLHIDSLMLRYINGIEFDFDKEDVFQFLTDKMKVKVVLPRSLFRDTDVDIKPLGLDCNFTFSCAIPKAIINLRFTRGKRQGAAALIWQTNLISRSNELPELPAGLSGWLESAHNIIKDWFFKLIEGDLLERFK